jgi:hypothetical protein
VLAVEQPSRHDDRGEKRGAGRLAANHPDLVRGVVLEDPPFFTTMLPRVEKTWNYVDLATGAHTFLASDEEDFVA